VSAEDNDKLLYPIQASEVKEVVFQMEKFKDQGPDGFGAGFFQDYGHVIKYEFAQ